MLIIMHEQPNAKLDSDRFRTVEMTFKVVQGHWKPYGSIENI